MSAIIEIIEPGMATSLQDAGRFGFRHLGMAVSGVLDLELLHCLNSLLGNNLNCATLEMRGSGPYLQIKSGKVRFALVGQLTGEIVDINDLTRPIKTWTTFTLNQGESLKISSISGGTAYLGISGGFDCEKIMASYSTYTRCQIGGINGKFLLAGLQLKNLEKHIVEANINKEYTQLQPWLRSEKSKEFCTIRVIFGPQQDYFSQRSLEQFCAGTYQISNDIDRMGMRLIGEKLEHLTTKGNEIISDGVTPGAIQVPADGQPIILLADCQTVGGYPKIATVITADLPLLAQLMPTNKIKFIQVNQQQAHEALLQQQQLLQRWMENITEYLPAGYIDEQNLYNQNLISGMVDAQER